MSLTSKQKDARKKPRMSALQRKTITLLFAGLALGLTRNPNQYFRIIKATIKEFDDINKGSLERAINSLYQSKLVETKSNRDGTMTLVLSKEGKQLALTYNIQDMSIKAPARWDDKWRIVMFDVPEPLKKVRDSLRMHFKSMGFYEFQKSVFVHPYPCAKEIEYIIEFYEVRKYVRFIVASDIDNALELRKHFKLS